MKQLTARGKTPKLKKKTQKPTKKRNHPQYGTSKLEEDFAKEFLDKLGVEYTYQFEAKDIKRWYDFYLPKHNLLIEIDGSYFHSDPRLVKENEMNPMQKRNKRVDEYKDKWALMHGIPIIRFWEKDIRENPKKVMDELKKRLYMESTKIALAEKKNKRHVNKFHKLR